MRLEVLIIIVSKCKYRLGPVGGVFAPSIPDEPETPWKKRVRESETRTNGRGGGGGEGGGIKRGGRERE